MDAGIVFGCFVPHPPVLVPEVGGDRAFQLQASLDAYRTVAGDVARHAPDTIVLVSPHAPIRFNAMGAVRSESYWGSLDAFGAGGVRFSFQNDLQLLEALHEECERVALPLLPSGDSAVPHRLDHGAMVPLYFLRPTTGSTRLLLLSFSDLPVDSHLALGRAIASACVAANRRVVLVASGDLSHRLIRGAPAGFDPQGAAFDQTVARLLREQDYDGLAHLDSRLRERAGECGYRSLMVALGALPGFRAEVLSYEGPFGVGYLVSRFVAGDDPQEDAAGAAAAEEGLSPEEKEVLDLARLAVESYVRDERLVAPKARPEGLLAGCAGVFVSLRLGGRLRGCIGTFQPTEANLAMEVIRNSVAAASRDPRFPPVSVEELDDLQYSVDILSTPEPVQSVEQLDCRRYGVLVKAGGQRGLLLPDLEGVDSVERQLSIAKQKAGIRANAPVEISRFTVHRIGKK